MSLKREDDGTVWMHEHLHTGFSTTYRLEETLFDSNTPELGGTLILTSTGEGGGASMVTL